MREYLAAILFNLIFEISKLSSTLVLLVVLTVICVIVLDSLHSYVQKQRSSTGLAAQAKTVSVDGLRELPGKTYVSDIQGIAGRPDAVVKENGFLIPVERKPLAKKVRDRYIAQLLVYMRLIEEFHGVKPPYGYLVLGSKCRRVKIYNSPEKQAWLQSLLNEMQAVLAGSPALAQPERNKCRKCSVRQHCMADLSQTRKQDKNINGLKILH